MKSSSAQYLFDLGRSDIVRMLPKIIPAGFAGVRFLLGKVTGVAKPGLAWYIPFIERIQLVEGRVISHTRSQEIKTADNIFATVAVSAQMQIVSPADYLTKLSDQNTIHAAIDDVTRTHLTRATLESIYVDQTGSMSDDLSKRLSEYGIDVTNVFVTSVDTSPEVKHSMDAVVQSKRALEVARNNAAADYEIAVKAAEAERDRKILHGEGISGQRQKIIDGVVQSMQELKATTGVSHEHLMRFILAHQQFDTMADIGRGPGAKTLFFERSDAALFAKLMADDSAKA